MYRFALLFIERPVSAEDAHVACPTNVKLLHAGVTLREFCSVLNILICYNDFLFEFENKLDIHTAQDSVMHARRTILKHCGALPPADGDGEERTTRKTLIERRTSARVLTIVDVEWYFSGTRIARVKLREDSRT